MRHRSFALWSSLWFALEGACLSAAVLASGCGTDEAAPAPLPASTRNHLVWKRHHAVAEDLAQALELPVDALCQELGRLDCVREVHLTSLGGHDPAALGLYEPPAQPLATSAFALERVALEACGRRVEQDRADAVVFEALDLSGPAPSSADDAFAATISTLYRRLLGREPIAAELEAHAGLLVDDEGEPVSAARFAQLACFTVATTTEFTFL